MRILSFRSRVWDWTTKENSTGIQLGSRSHAGTGHNCWDKDLMDLLIRSTRRKAVTTQELFPLPVQKQFFLLASLLFHDAFFYRFFRGRGKWWALTISNNLFEVSVTPTTLTIFVAAFTFVWEKDFQVI